MTGTEDGHDALMAVARALNENENARILAALAPEGSALHGAQVADLLDRADDNDSYLGKTEPFHEAHAAELPDVPGLRYAILAVCMLDAPLTVASVEAILRRADLLPDFDCAAYGPEGRDFGALCFIGGDLWQRACASLEACHRVMAAERRRVFERINEMAADGDPTGVFLAGEFTEPGQILGGGDS